jgi:hypothetical protein
MADPITPDMQGAGLPGMPEPTSQGGLLDALRSRGTLPGILPPQMLAQSMQQAGPGPNVGLAMGSGALNVTGGGNPAQNPYLQQYQAQQNAKIQQALQMQRLQQIERQNFVKQNEMALNIAEQASKSDDPTARLWGWQEKSRLGGPLGIQIPKNIVQGLATGKLSTEQMAKVVGMADEKILPEDIARVVGLPPALVQQGIEIAKSDPTRRILKIPTRAEAEAGRVKDQQEALALAQKEWGLADSKDPRVPFATEYTMRQFGVSFNKATHAQQKEAVEKASAVAPAKTETTAEIKNALAESGLPTNTSDSSKIQSAIVARNARKFSNQAKLAAQSGQLSVAGALYKAETDRVIQKMTALRSVDNLADDMARYIEQGRQLGITNNLRILNALRQGFWSEVGGPDSDVAKWYRGFGTLDARFATVAQTVENVTGNRLAQQTLDRALGYHPKISDPYTVQLQVLDELRRAARNVRDDVNIRAQSAAERFSAAAGSAGVPFILRGGHGGVESVEEEK